jgi:hypothetical protein
VDDGELPAGGRQCEGLEIAAEETNRTKPVKEKPVMRKVRRTLPIVLTALAMLGLLAVSSQAKKPVPPPLPTLVKLTGGIEIQSADNTGDPTRVRVKFIDSSLRIPYPITDPETYTQGQEFISNPDYSYSPPMPPDTPSLSVTGTSANKTLAYFYCANILHQGKGTADLRCDLSAEHADYYYCLVISGGKVQKTGAVVFPTGSNWMVNKKTPSPGSTVAQGTLAAPVTYKVIQ